MLSTGSLQACGKRPDIGEGAQVNPANLQGDYGFGHTIGETTVNHNPTQTHITIHYVDKLTIVMPDDPDQAKSILDQIMPKSENNGNGQDHQ